MITGDFYTGDSIPFGWTELSIAIGFLSLCAISFIAFLRSVPFLYSDSATGD